MSQINIFIGKEISPEFTKFINDPNKFKNPTEITISEDELHSPYYSVLSFRHKHESPIDSVGFRNITGFPGPLKTKSFVFYRDRSDKTLYTDVQQQEDQDELNFLKTLHLAFEKDNETKIYIHKFAEIFYNTGNGLFYSSDITKKITDIPNNEFNRFLNLMYYYVLPGRYWRSYYNNKFLSTEIAESTQHTENMNETEFMWNQIEYLLNDLHEEVTGAGAGAGATGAASNPFGLASSPAP